MRTFKRAVAVILPAAFLSLGLLAEEGRAQTGKADREIIAIVPESFPLPDDMESADVLAMLYFDVLEGQDVILLNPEMVSGEALRTAMLSLRHRRQTAPDDLTQLVISSSSGAVGVARNGGSEDRGVANAWDRLVAELLARPMGGVMGLGAARFIPITQAPDR